MSLDSDTDVHGHDDDNDKEKGGKASGDDKRKLPVHVGSRFNDGLRTCASHQ